MIASDADFRFMDCFMGVSCNRRDVRSFVSFLGNLQGFGSDELGFARQFKRFEKDLQGFVRELQGLGSDLHGFMSTFQPLYVDSSSRDGHAMVLGNSR